MCLIRVVLKHFYSFSEQKTNIHSQLLPNTNTNWPFWRGEWIALNNFHSVFLCLFKILYAASRWFGNILSLRQLVYTKLLFHSRVEWSEHRTEHYLRGNIVRWKTLFSFCYTGFGLGANYLYCCHACEHEVSRELPVPACPQILTRRLMFRDCSVWQFNDTFVTNSVRASLFAVWSAAPRFRNVGAASSQWLPFCCFGVLVQNLPFCCQKLFLFMRKILLSPKLSENVSFCHAVELISNLCSFTRVVTVKTLNPS